MENDSIIRTLSTIYEPNKTGLAFNYVENTDTVINVSNFISPSCFANFRLGALKGSGCDTIVSGIGEVKEGRLKVYPNPARDVLTVELSENTGEASLALFSVTGQQLLYMPLYLSSQEIKIAHLPPGLYLAKLTNSDGTSSTQRIVIAR
ncbi:MAG: T9SS type A sorting domain-containing protein [Bacteroidia bacterium]|nr:T9SS type A sorting domain-containing protein [Bacteroidia bacterium]